jgi:hypothetical protein
MYSKQQHKVTRAAVLTRLALEVVTRLAAIRLALEVVTKLAETWQLVTWQLVTWQLVTWQALPQSLAAQQLAVAAAAPVAAAMAAAAPVAAAMAAVAAAAPAVAAAVNNLKYRPTIQSAATYFFFDHLSSMTFEFLRNWYCISFSNVSVLSVLGILFFFFNLSYWWISAPGVKTYHKKPSP